MLLVDIIERTCRAAVVHEIENIGRCMKIFSDKGEFTVSFKPKPCNCNCSEVLMTSQRSLITEGSNLRGMWALADELVDLDRLSSNDIYAILTTFGVEAARRAIIDEVSSVFGAYGIAVDYRHLTIIADYMVCCSVLDVSNSSLMFCFRLMPVASGHSTVLVSQPSLHRYSKRLLKQPLPSCLRPPSTVTLMT